MEINDLLYYNERMKLYELGRTMTFWTKVVDLFAIQNQLNSICGTWPNWLSWTDLVGPDLIKLDGLSICNVPKVTTLSEVLLSFSVTVIHFVTV